MAITKVIDTPIKREERTDEVVIYAPLGQGYHVRVLRVTRDFFADAPPVEVGRRWITRSMARLRLDSAALPLLGSLPSIFDRWSQDDDHDALTRSELEASVAVVQASADAAHLELTSREAELLLAVGRLNAALTGPDLEARRVAQADADAASILTVSARSAYTTAAEELFRLRTQLAALPAM